ncbi:MAG: oxidoreductase, partial [Chthoniobacteraceae bacterium]
MLPALSSYLIREHVGVFKLTGTYDIFDGTSGQQIALAKERKGLLNALAGMLVNKRNLPTRVDVHEGADENGPIAFSITRGFSFLRPTVQVLAGDGSLIGTFKSRLLTLGGKFGVYDAGGNEVAMVKGNWVGWDFRFIASNGTELGVVSRNWG